VETRTRADLLETIRRDRRRFDDVLERIPAERMTDPVLPGGWSVKDVLAHIAWGERESIGVVRARALVGSPLWDVGEDERNAAVVRESRSRSLEAVVDDYRSTFDEFMAALEELSDEELNTPDRFERMPERAPGWLPWRVLYDPGHYDEHARTIEEARQLLDLPADADDVRRRGDALELQRPLPGDVECPPRRIEG
jgi:uncharacterized protein (TIGR03083 family)